jgi:hypothetical protein
MGPDFSRQISLYRKSADTLCTKRSPTFKTVYLSGKKYNFSYMLNSVEFSLVMPLTFKQLCF